MQLNVLTEPSEKLFQLAADQLLQELGGPTLVHIPGVQPQPVFVSVLLHGNECSGWYGVQQMMREFPALPRSVLLFIGNVQAAASGVRTLSDQVDFNRIWRNPPGPDYAFVKDLLAQVAKHKPVFAVDLHNNTGKNPHYSVLTSQDPASRALAYLFSDRAVLIDEPDTVLSRALQAYCPSIAVEVGPVNDSASDLRAADFLRRCLKQSELSADPGDQLQLFRAVARLHVAEQTRFDFVDDVSARDLALDDLLLTAGIEAINFHEIEAGFEIGFNRLPLHRSLQVLDTQHQDVTVQFLQQRDGIVTLRQPVVPAMFTTNKVVARQDCLGYLMHKIAYCPRLPE